MQTLLGSERKRPINTCHLSNSFTALDSPSPWDITSQNNTGTSVAIRWSGFPGGLQPNFFIISVNQTTVREDSGDHHHGDQENKPVRILKIVESSQTSAVISELSASTEYLAIVYMVDNNNDIYKSNSIAIETEESGESV